jgi:ADP-heptose:LPS heptosyltransferase
VKILVIKLGALGDFVQALGPFAAIRAHHPDAAITLLTVTAYADFARASPYFDAVWIDDRPGLLNLPALFDLRSRLRAGHFDFVYDLQTSSRSSAYFRLMGPGRRPSWSGIAPRASHPHANPRRDFMHTLDRQADQLRMAGIASVPAPDLAWARADIARFGLPNRFVLLVPGGAAHRPDKRWPIAAYIELAQWLAAQGATPVVIGGTDEADLGRAIRAGCSAAVDLTGRTGFAEIVGLGATALHAVGNDTGPMHLIAAGGAAATVLYSGASDPALTQPRGPGITVLRRERLADLTVAEVAATVRLG